MRITNLQPENTFERKGRPRTYQFAAIVALSLITTLSLAGPASAQLVGLWEFENNSNLRQATIGTDLVATGTDTATAGSGGSDSGAASLDLNDFYTATNPIGANGGGTSKTNEYTIVMDILDSSSGFNALLDMSLDGDGDTFINGAGGVGISGDYAGVVNDGNWHRVVFAFDLGSDAPMTRYVDGESFGVVNVNDPTIDGRFGLQSTFTAFSDNGGGEEFTTSISNLALFNETLDASTISILGTAGSPIFTEPPKLGITVEKGSGNIIIENDTEFPQEINFYEILSESGTLTSSWNSFADQGLDSLGGDPEDNWQEGGGSGSDILTEAFLLGSTTIDANGGSETLGGAYAGGVGGAEDLIFRYGLTSGGLVTGNITYDDTPPSGIAGDFSGSGAVGNDDLTLLLDNWGATVPPTPAGWTNDLPTAPAVGNDDLTRLLDNWGNTALSASAVPEPTSLVLVGMGLAGLLLTGRKR